MKTALIALYIIGALGTASMTFHMDKLRGDCNAWPLRYVIHGVLWPFASAAFTIMFLSNTPIGVAPERCK